MRAEIAIRALLAQSTDLTAIMPASSIYPLQLPQGAALPALLTEHISTTTLPKLADAYQLISAERTRLSVHAVSTSYAQVQALIEIIRATCHGYRGTIAGVNVGQIAVDLVGPALRDDDMSLYSQSVDLMILTHP